MGEGAFRTYLLDDDGDEEIYGPKESTRYKFVAKRKAAESEDADTTTDDSESEAVEGN